MENEIDDQDSGINGLIIQFDVREQPNQDPRENELNEQEP